MGLEKHQDQAGEVEPLRQLCTNSTNEKSDLDQSNGQMILSQNWWQAWQLEKQKKNPIEKTSQMGLESKL